MQTESQTNLTEVLVCLLSFSSPVVNARHSFSHFFSFFFPPTLVNLSSSFPPSPLLPLYSLSKVNCNL
ncbi:hypothetical protein PUN28_008818 [Cardiocondyla obscurior]|uniref:Uncharacterized protein n=1 Tax=Cardiocondyla obscurior TaxID=286306 RepID=A0AAW2FRF5_9HYME